MLLHPQCETLSPSGHCGNDFVIDRSASGTYNIPKKNDGRGGRLPKTEYRSCPPHNMMASLDTLSEIYGFHAIGDRLGTAGQPTEAQLSLIRQCGFDTVINLALPTSDNAIAHEGSAVTRLGMSYVHLPVDFKSPKAQDFRAFRRVMDAFDDRAVFVHCAANMRVSAFVFLYRVLSQHVPVAEAREDLHAIWQPDDVWSRFIQEQLFS